MIDLKNRLEERLTKSRSFYLIVFLVMVPYFAISPIRGEFYLFSIYEETLTIWSILLDVFNNTIALLVLYSMAMVLWIILNISWALNEVESSAHHHIIKIDLFDVDKVGGLKPIRNLILKLVVYQFIAISMASFSFVTATLAITGFGNSPAKSPPAGPLGCTWISPASLSWVTAPS